MFTKYLLRPFILSTALLFICGCNVDEVDEALDGGLVDDGGEFEDDADGLGGAMEPDAMPEDSDTCSEDDECSEDSETCLVPEGENGGYCGECLDHTYCPEERPFCNVDGVCTDEDEGVCREDLDCEEEPRLQCRLLSSGDIGSCVECTSDDDCVAPRPVCATTGLCAQSGDAGCETDAECGPLLNCVEANCVEP